MIKSVMFDIETLGTDPDSIIVSFGACRFNFGHDITDKMTLLLDMKEQEDLGRTVSVATIKWWMEQSQEARDWNFNDHNRYPCSVALRAFTTFCQGADLFWCRGTNFDPILLESLFKQLDLKVPWRYNNLRDVRTFDELVKPRADLTAVAHKPLDDCEVQVEQVREVHRVFAQAMELERVRTMGRPEGMGIAKLAEEIPSETLEDSLARSGPVPADQLTPEAQEAFERSLVTPRCKSPEVFEALRQKHMDQAGIAEDPPANVETAEEMPRDPGKLRGKDEKLVTDEIQF